MIIAIIIMIGKITKNDFWFCSGSAIRLLVCLGMWELKLEYSYYFVMTGMSCSHRHWTCPMQLSLIIGIMYLDKETPGTVFFPVLLLCTDGHHFAQTGPQPSFSPPHPPHKRWSTHSSLSNKTTGSPRHTSHLHWSHPDLSSTLPPPAMAQVCEDYSGTRTAQLWGRQPFLVGNFLRLVTHKKNNKIKLPLCQNSLIYLLLLLAYTKWSKNIFWK